MSMNTVVMMHMSGWMSPAWLTAQNLSVNAWQKLPETRHTNNAENNWRTSWMRVITKLLASLTNWMSHTWSLIMQPMAILLIATQASSAGSVFRAARAMRDHLRINWQN